MTTPISIAIDGPAGAGKSTLARRVSEALGYLYIDTGALYRTVGLHAVDKTGGFEDAEAVIASLPDCRIEMKITDGQQVIYLNGSPVGDAIRTPRASMAASAVSALPEVREFLLSLQRDVAAKNNIVMDGRDIGTVILPQAQIKIFLTAQPQIRARRRYDELIAKGADVKYEDVLADLEKRDKNDSSRTAAPLRAADDAVILDTSELDFEQSFASLMQIISKHIG